MKVTTDGCLFGGWVAEEIKNEKLKINKSLDIGTGTGLLSLILAQKNPAVTIHAIEIDKDAGKQARENIDASPWKDRIDILEGNVKDYSFPEKFDLIISNPPFYENELKSESQKKNIAHHSENLTLEELLSIIKKNLNRNGHFYLLLPTKRNEEISSFFIKNKLQISKMIFVRQSINHDYFRILLSGKHKQDELSEIELDEISICDEKQEYTKEFTELLKDYYLYL